MCLILNRSSVTLSDLVSLSAYPAEGLWLLVGWFMNGLSLCLLLFTFDGRGSTL